MTETCGRDALALITLAVHGELETAYDYLEGMDERGVDFEHALIDLAGLAGNAVRNMSTLSGTSADTILANTGRALAAYEAQAADVPEVRVVAVDLDTDGKLGPEIREFLRANFGIDLDADEDDGDE